MTGGEVGVKVGVFITISMVAVGVGVLVSAG